MRGSGDSPGEFGQTTFAGMVGDFVAVAARHAVSGLPVVCAGISIGGVPATVGAHRLWRDGDVKVAGVVLMSSDLVEGVRFGAGAVTAIRGGEFHLPETFFRERESIRPRALLRQTALPFLLVYGRGDDKAAAESAWFRQNGGDVVAIDGDHLFESTAARQALLAAWLAFLIPVVAGPPPLMPATKEGERP
jgi:pimeloyl-ACP methyl ester carboxylesterase